MRVLRAVLSAALLSGASCGGSSTDPNSSVSNSCSAGISATVNGAAWCSPLAQATVSKSIVSMSGFDSGFTSTIGIAFVASAPGTYALTLSNGAGGSATYSKAGQGWTSGIAGGTGSITLTTLTANHIVGTFAFDAVPASGGASGTIHVVGGQINMTF